MPRRKHYGGNEVTSTLGAATWIALFCGIVVTLSITTCAALREGNNTPVVQLAPDTITVDLAGQPHTLELALSPIARTHGLMGRPTMADNHGMLFFFPDEDIRDFWMRNCLIPLDIIFIDQNLKIDSIHSLPAPSPGTPPHEIPRATSVGPCQYVIELNAGRADKLGLKPGQILDLPLDSLKPHVR